MENEEAEDQNTEAEVTEQAEETERKPSIFDTIPDDFVPASQRPEPKGEVHTDDEGADEEPDDDAEPESKAKDDKPKKTDAEYAQERRQAKLEKRKKAEKFDDLLTEKERLAQEKQDLEAKLSDLTSKTKEHETEELTLQEEVETLREQVKQADQRYIAAYNSTVNPMEDEQVKNHASAAEQALRSNTPRRINGQRVNFDAAWKKPETHRAVNQSLAAYAHATQSGDEEAIEKAIQTYGAALGISVDDQDDDTAGQLEDALAAAAEPFSKGLSRVQEVQANAGKYAFEQRAQAVKQTETALLAPLRIDPEAADEVLEKNPGHPWGNFAKLANSMPEEFREAIEDELERDAMVVASLQYQPLPLDQDASAEDIQKHQQMIAASGERLQNMQQYLAVGRAMIDGGLLPHLRSKMLDAEKRLEETAASESIPDGDKGKDKPKEQSKGAGFYANVPGEFAQR